MHQAEKPNVLPFRSDIIFSNQTRKRLEHSVSAFTEKPSETVNAFEQALCAQIVAAAREFVTRVFTDLGHKVVRSLTKK